MILSSSNPTNSLQVLCMTRDLWQYLKPGGISETLEETSRHRCSPTLMFHLIMKEVTCFESARTEVSRIVLISIGRVHHRTSTFAQC